MAFQSNSSNLRNESINSFWFSLSIRENPWVSSIRLKSSFPPLKRVVIYFSRGNSPLSSKMEYNWFPFPYIPHRNNNFVFSYNNRMLLIQGAYKRQKADRTGSGFGNGTAGHIRFIYDTGFRCCQQIVDSFIESGLHPLKTSLLERAAKTLKRAMFISRFLPPDRSNRMASTWYG